ncbi:hypothetical protein QE152_g24261 [Popillia japonica]|uniref:Uncharacterized protein n=1 Tax=Popillia japonica TaxID=7064 RepID=A0AAW1KGD8_POPJA
MSETPLVPLGAAFSNAAPTKHLPAADHHKDHPARARLALVFKKTEESKYTQSDSDRVSRSKKWFVKMRQHESIQRAQRTTLNVCVETYWDLIKRRCYSTKRS